jgi:hypothetical protein
MIEAYSKNVTVTTNSTIPLNNVAIDKGCGVSINGSTITFNKCGVYKVTVSASTIATVIGVISFQLFKNGIAQTQAGTSETASDTTSLHSMSFTTFVQVPVNNCRCDSCTSPTTVNIVNTGVGTTYNNVDVVVDKID